ncbi:hypothetical protein [Romboutsia sp.]|uniref:hypothetical protein n=1 Tax=Romboutsia sp. TaxID=1965302 RepID=UPI003F2BEDF4
MLESSAAYVLVRTIPESIVLILAGMILSSKKINKKEIIIKGILFGVIVTFIRILPITFGVHTILSMLAFAVIIFENTDRETIKTMIIMCEVWIATVLSEGIYVVIATSLFKIPFDLLMNNKDLKGALLTLPSLLIIICIVIVIKKIEEKIKKISRS